MNDELKELINKASELLNKAQEARSEVINYMEEHYAVSGESLDYYNYFEDECDWCYGISEREILLAINNSNTSKEN